jgi:hypothetical protein
MKAMHEPIHHCAEVGGLRALWTASAGLRVCVATPTRTLSTHTDLRRPLLFRPGGR